MENKKNTIFKPHATLQARIKVLALFVLLTGAASSLFIYHNGQDIPPVYDLAVSRIYLSNLELYGGMIHVLLTDLTGWFCGLWQGKDLAFTIAYLTVIVSAGLFFIAKLYSLDAVDEHVGTIE